VREGSAHVADVARRWPHSPARAHRAFDAVARGRVAVLDRRGLPVSTTVGNFSKTTVSCACGVARPWHTKAKGNTVSHYSKSAQRIRSVAQACGFARIGDISASRVQERLAELRRDGLGIATVDHYLRCLKSFTRWLVRDRRTTEDRLLHLSFMNAEVDRRHARRALLPEEFCLPVAAARIGKSIEHISGADRAMMYVLAAWTGLRKGEIGSLTLRSFPFDADPPFVCVAAGYSKRKRTDRQVLHPELVRQLQEWLASQTNVDPDELLFPVSGRVPGGFERKTCKMMRCDLSAAREKWIAAAETPVETKRRKESDFLKYRNAAGAFADFHSNRHTFITTLERSGVRPKVAQTLARHSDIRLTLGIYTHAELADQTDAIASLPAPPGPKSQAPAAEATRDESPPSEADQPRDFSPAPPQSEVPTGADIGAIQFAAETIQIAPFCTLDGGVTGDSVVSYALGSRENCNRAGGIRTPDQGIMSPLL
jgi:site-specific recombinase XerD